MDKQRILAITLLVVFIIIVIIALSRSEKPKHGVPKKHTHIDSPACSDKIYMYSPSEVPEDEPSEEDPPPEEPCADCFLARNEIAFDVEETGLENFWSVAVQSTGKIIAGEEDIIFRFNSNGTLDTSFGSGGYVYIPSYSFNDLFRIRIGAGDLIYVCTAGYDVNIVRFTADGVLDTSFAGTGRFAGGPNNTANSAGVIDIYVYADNSVLASRVVDTTVYKVTSAGIYDPSFTNINYVIPGYTVRRISNILAYDDKIYLFGFIRDNNFDGEHAFIGRANFNGTIDLTFGSGGYVIIQPADVGLTDIFGMQTYGGCTIDSSNGDLYWVGSIDTIDDGDYFICIIKLDKDGVVDTNYGSNGIVINTREDLSLSYQYSEAYGNSHILPCDKSLVMTPINYSSAVFTYVWRVAADGTTISQVVDDINSEVYYWECTPDGNGNLIVAGQQWFPNPDPEIPVLRSFSCEQLDYRMQDNAV